MISGWLGSHRPPPQPSIARYFWKRDVTLCIPAYRAAEFIVRTLRCAEGQTYGRIRILVSVDHSRDETASICRTFAGHDRRIEVVDHGERLGWSGNVNFLLDRVDTPFFFLYFHDDVILPQYCEFLRNALLRSPEAASGNCDVYNFGDRQGIAPGHAYEGPIARRLLSLWLPSLRGRPLRSMVRSSKVDSNYRLPPEAADSFVSGETLVMRLMAAGPAVHVAEPLYMRWHRKGGVTDGWQSLSFETLLNGWRDELARAFAIIDEGVVPDENRTALKHVLVLWVVSKLVGRCLAEKRALPAPKDLHQDAPDLELAHDFSRFGSDIAANVRERQRVVLKGLRACATAHKAELRPSGATDVRAKV